jgi:hypothetical protein
VGERGHRTPYELRARRILSNAGSLPLVYQQRITDPVQWDGAMIDAACAEMAARLAYPITQSASMAQTMQGRAAQALREAQAISGQDNPPEDWADSPFIEARF